MARSKNTFGFWSGVLFAILGAVLVYFGIDFPNTNMNTFVYPQIISGGLIVIGGVAITIGIIKMLLWAFGLDNKD